MAKEVTIHNIDVGIRTIVMNRARKRLNNVREEERRQNGVPTTTLATVGRQILTNWMPPTSAGNVLDAIRMADRAPRITQRGHRKYEIAERDQVPTRKRDATDEERVNQLLKHLVKVSNPDRGTALGPIGLVSRAAKREGLLGHEVQGKSLQHHIKAAERRVLKPFRFTLPEDLYQDILKKLIAYNTTVTNALEEGLQEFARTGKTDPEG